VALLEKYNHENQTIQNNIFDGLFYEQKHILRLTHRADYSESPVSGIKKHSHQMIIQKKKTETFLVLLVGEWNLGFLGERAPTMKL
jgi:hypothetical protein